ncbi:protein of unknown function [Streptomyces sp. KY75]|nr:protein of unknown function [Streptomyces sp. KY75]CAD5991262.1 protein of unknown function [Streptomyces sp. KY70]
MFHEGVPGHHLQLGMTALNTTTLNRFQRLACELHPGHCEGWGLYAERLVDKLGYFVDPAHRLGIPATGQLLRAAQIVPDVGLPLRLPHPRGRRLPREGAGGLPNWTAHSSPSTADSVQRVRRLRDRPVPGEPWTGHLLQAGGEGVAGAEGRGPPPRRRWLRPEAVPPAGPGPGTDGLGPAARRAHPRGPGRLITETPDRTNTSGAHHMARRRASG